MTNAATPAQGAGQILLCLDTSSDAAVAVCRVPPAPDAAPNAAGQVQVLARARSGDGRRHAETLVPMIQQVLSSAGMAVPCVDAVVVGTGPAPFTGLRVGLATARAFACARSIEAYGVCSLDALAIAAVDLAAQDPPGTPGVQASVAGDPAEARELLVVTDAKRREVYYARYRTGGDEVVALAGPAVATPAQVAGEHHDLVAAGAVYGPALDLYPGILGTGSNTAGSPGAGGDTPPHGERAAPVDPGALARLAVHRRARDGDLSLTPRYLRRPDVHVSASRKRAS